MTGYTKHPVGNKLFTIEWEFVAAESQVIGEAFEAVDCKAVSLAARGVVVSGELSFTMRLSNLEGTPVYPEFGGDHEINLESGVGNNMFIPWPNAADTEQAGLSLPRARFYFPIFEAQGVGSSANGRVAILFEEL